MPKNSIDFNVIIWFILTPYLNPTSQPSPFKPQDYTSPNNSALTHTHKHLVIRPLLHEYGIKYRM